MGIRNAHSEVQCSGDISMNRLVSKYLRLVEYNSYPQQQCMPEYSRSVKISGGPY